VEATASSSENSIKTPDKAIDGNATSSDSRWSSAFSNPQWLKIDLGSVQDISRVILDWESASSADYDIQVSDTGANGSWVVVATRTSSSSQNHRIDDIGDLDTAGRYVRIYSRARTTQYGNSLYEVKVLGRSCTTDPCGRELIPVSASASSSENSTKTPDKAIDSSLTTRWSSQFSDPQWFTIDLGVKQFISAVVLDWENAASRNYTIQVADAQNGPWQLIHAKVGAPNGPRVDTIEGLNAQGRFVKLTSTARTTQYGISLFDVQIFGGDSAGACSGPTGKGGAGEVIDVRIPLPAGTNVDDVVLGGEDGIVIGSGVSVPDGTVVSPTGGVSAGSNNQLPDIVAGEGVNIGPGSTIGGQILAGEDVELGDGATTGGVSDHHSFGTPTTVGCSLVVPASSGGDFLVHTGSSRILLPGSFGTVTVESGAKLYLGDGQYFFADLHVASGGELVLDSTGGFTVALVTSSLNVLGAVTHLGPGTPKLFLGYGGTQSVRIGGTFIGHVVAPNANVDIESGSVVGSIFGKVVTALNGVTISAQSIPLDFVCGERPVDMVTIDKLDASTRLCGTQEHGTGLQFPAQESFTGTVELKIPHRFLVTEGNAGNHVTVLQFVTVGQNVTCNYRGSASVDHPTTRLEIARGMEYQFENCSDGSVPGTIVPVTFAALTVSGDIQSTFGDQTEVCLSLGENVCQPMGSIISPGNAIEMVEQFTWHDGKPYLREYDLDNRPLLYYANIYIENAKQMRRLTEFLISYKQTPLFHTELPDDYFGSCGTLTPSGDLEGEWVFAVLPGRTYNALLRLAVDPGLIVTNPADREQFRAIVLREVPDEARGPFGELSYDALIEAGFQYSLPRGNSIAALPDTNAVLSQPVAPGGAVAAAVDAVDFVVGLAEDAVRVATSILGVIDFLLSGKVKVDVDVDILNRGAFFDMTAPFQSGWGLQRADGREQSIPGATVEIWQVSSRLYSAGLPIPTRFAGRVNQAGQVRLEVAKGGASLLRGVTWFGALCIEAENNAASMTPHIIPSLWCDYAPRQVVDGQVVENDTFGGFEEDVAVNPRLNDPTLYELAEFSEAWEYSASVLGYTPPPARALTSFAVRILDDGPFVGCFKIGETIDLSSVSSLVPSVELSAAMLSLMPDVDIFLPPGPWDNRRGIGNHEYGHYIFCGLIKQEGGLASASLLDKLIVQSMTEGAEADPSDDARTINEGFADFIASQTVGGVNYFAPPSTTGGVFSICNNSDPGAPCLDRNYSLATPDGKGRAHIGQITTTLHDIFDGWSKFQLAPTNADFWSGSPLMYQAQAYGDFGDEVVALSGGSVSSVVSNFLALMPLAQFPGPITWESIGYNVPNFQRAMANTMREQGASWCDACRVMALHEEGITTTSLVVDMWDLCLNADFGPSMGAPPDPSLTMSETCTPCGATEVRVDRSCAFNGMLFPGTCADNSLLGQDRGPLCAACGPGRIANRQLNTCVDCPVGTVASPNNECVPCEWNEIVVGSTCVACPFGQGADRTTNTCEDCPADVHVDWSALPEPECAFIDLPELFMPGDICPDQFWVLAHNTDILLEAGLSAKAYQTTSSTPACSSSEVTVSVVENNTVLTQSACTGLECTFDFCPFPPLGADECTYECPVTLSSAEIAARSSVRFGVTGPEGNHAVLRLFSHSADCIQIF
jgi:hypothetical protein